MAPSLWAHILYIPIIFATLTHSQHAQAPPWIFKQDGSLHRTLSQFLIRTSIELHESAKRMLSRVEPNQDANATLEEHYNGIIGSIPLCQIDTPYKQLLTLLETTQNWLDEIPADKPGSLRYEIKYNINELLLWTGMLEANDVDGQLQWSFYTHVEEFEFIRTLLHFLFDDHPSAFLFYSHLYFSPYVRLRDQKQTFVRLLGRGASADVVLIRQPYTSDSSKVRMSALKIFHGRHKRPMHEMEVRIMRKIQKQLVGVRVPQFYGYGLDDWDCSYSMQYIDGPPVRINDLTAFKILRQISEIIVKLGQIGIGHMDINEHNILQDKQGDYWLVDFGLAADLSPDLIKPGTKGGMLPLYGSLMYMSPDAFMLNAVLYEKWKRRVSELSEKEEMALKQSLIKANLFSLQAMVLYSLLPYQHPTVLDLRQYGSKVHQLYQDGRLFDDSGVLPTNLTNNYYRSIWKLYRLGVDQLFASNLLLRTSMTREMFAMLLKQYD